MCHVPLLDMTATATQSQDFPDIRISPYVCDVFSVLFSVGSHRLYEFVFFRGKNKKGVQINYSCETCSEDLSGPLPGSWGLCTITTPSDMQLHPKTPKNACWLSMICAA